MCVPWSIAYLHTIYFFFFQAEDGIRDYKVTGVQTCALPIYGTFGDKPLFARFFSAHVMQDASLVNEQRVRNDLLERWIVFRLRTRHEKIIFEIGRASCRERV